MEQFQVQLQTNLLRRLKTQTCADASGPSSTGVLINGRQIQRPRCNPAGKLWASRPIPVAGGLKQTEIWGLKGRLPRWGLGDDWDSVE